MELTLAILGAVLGSSGVTTIIVALLNRRWAKKDRGDAKLDAVVEAQKLIMLDRVRYLGRNYISQQEIHLEDKETLEAMHKAYKKLGGNGHLDTLMEEVERLPVVV